ncbi:hypothetical protein ACXO8G_05490 [Lactobacillus delbrueckii subsp. bulgaricus]
MKPVIVAIDVDNQEQLTKILLKLKAAATRGKSRPEAVKIQLNKTAPTKLPN